MYACPGTDTMESVSALPQVPPDIDVHPPSIVSVETGQNKNTHKWNERVRRLQHSMVHPGNTLLNMASSTVMGGKVRKRSIARDKEGATNALFTHWPSLKRSKLDVDSQHVPSRGIGCREGWNCIGAKTSLGYGRTK